MAIIAAKKRIFGAVGEMMASLEDMRSAKPMLFLASAWLFFSFLLFLHNPRLILHSEFWGEDGPVWYAQAYEFGLSSLLRPIGGYLNSLQRIAALIAQGVPLWLAPTVMALFALFVQTMSAAFLLSRKMDDAWSHWPSRLAFSLLFVLMPNAPETSVNATDSQWYLAILAFLVVVSRPAKSYAGAAVEAAVLLVSGLSGPFSVILGPIALARAITSTKAERRARIWRLLIIGATAAVQCALVLGVSHSGRVTGPLGAEPLLLVKILAMIPLGATLGYEGVGHLIRSGWMLATGFPFLVLVSACVMVCRALLARNRLLLEFLFFAAVMLGLALAKPLISSDQPQWPLILSPPAGNRYFLYPMIAWWGSLFVLLPIRSIFRVFSVTLLGITAIVAIPLDWGDRFHLPRTNFVAKAKYFEQAPIGTVMDFPVHPPGVLMQLRKIRGDVSNSGADMPVVSCTLDLVDGHEWSDAGGARLAPERSVELVGWAVDGSKAPIMQPKVYLRGNKTYELRTSTGSLRPDVAKALNSEDAAYSGFRAMLPVDLEPGTYQVMVGSLNGKSLCDTGRAVTK